MLYFAAITCLISTTSLPGVPENASYYNGRVEVRRVALSDPCPEFTLDLGLHPSGGMAGVNGGIVELGELKSLMESLEVNVKPNTATLRLLILKPEKTPQEVILTTVREIVKSAPKKKKIILFVVDN